MLTCHGLHDCCKVLSTIMELIKQLENCAMHFCLWCNSLKPFWVCKRSTWQDLAVAVVFMIPFRASKAVHILHRVDVVAGHAVQVRTMECIYIPHNCLIMTNLQQTSLVDCVSLTLNAKMSKRESSNQPMWSCLLRTPATKAKDDTELYCELWHCKRQ